MRPWIGPPNRRGARSACHDGAMTSTETATAAAGAAARLPLRRPGRVPSAPSVPGARGVPSARGVPRAPGASGPAPGPPALPRHRPSGRALAGVCAGIAAHLGVPAGRVRLAFVLASLTGGAGVVLYALLWVLVPAGDPWAEAAGTIPPRRARLAARPTTLRRVPGRVRDLLGGAALVLAAIVLALWRAGALSGSGRVLPLLIVALGTALAWAQVDAVTGQSQDRSSLLRLAGGVALVAVGILLWVADDTAPGMLLTGAVTGGALVLGVGLVLLPLWLRTNRALADTRAAEAREAERADIAAHLHDSVLQTLTLIRKRADEPEVVARLARSQERELRAWLYTDRPAAGTSAADAVRDVVGEIEDRHGVDVDLVVVGDRPPGRDTEVVIAAAREALANAVRHGAPPVSVYAELGAQGTELFIRDHGPGFDPDGIAPDRHGVRESIIGRMERHGGSAAVRRLPDGTEVRLRLGAAPSGAPSPVPGPLPAPAPSPPPAAGGATDPPPSAIPGAPEPAPRTAHPTPGAS